MNILLIRPAPHPDSIGLQKFMICEPLELEYLSAGLERDGHRVTIIDMLLEKEQDFVSLVRRAAPDLVGFTAYIVHVARVIGYARRIKEILPEVPVTAGGVHAECNPADFEDPSIDYIVKTNGMETMRALARELTGTTGGSDLRAGIPGIWNGPDKTYVPDAAWHNVPFPDRTKTARYRHRYNYIFHEKCAIIKTSFGCPYTCDFCYCIAITQHRYLARPIEEVVEELAGIEEKNVFIVDDNFLVDLDRIRTFCRLLDEKGIRKNYILFGRADFIVEHADIIRLLADHGLKAVFVGIESFREEELADYGKKTTVEMNTRAVHILEDMGLECYSGIMVGMDWERKDFNTLIRHLRRFKMPMLNIQPVTPMPGTPLYDTLNDRVTVPRQEYHLWDMAHLLMEPAKISRRRFYWNIIRVYYLTSTGLKGHRYVFRHYGLKIYRRTIYGVLYLTWQYLKLVIRG